MSEFQILKSQMGRDLLYVSGYTFYLKSHDEDKTIKNWECRYRTHIKDGLKSCAVTCRTDYNITQILKEPGNHSHNFDCLAKEINAFKELLRQGGTDNRASNAIIINDALSKFEPEIHGYLPTKIACNNIIRNARQKAGHLVKEITSVEDMKEELQNTIGNRPRQFLQTVVKAGEDGAHALIFATEESLESLIYSQIWFADGIYKVTDKPYLQVYVIHGILIGDTMKRVMPLVYCIMSHKRLELYSSIFSFIEKYRLEKGYELRTKFVMIDFEIAVKSAIESIFNNQIEVYGCSFHLMKTLRERAQESDKNIFSTQKEQLNYNKIVALSYLPLNRLNILLPILEEYLRSTESPLLNLLLWFKHTYIREGSRFEGWWNVNKLIVNRLPTTNNNAESFFSKFRKLLDGQRSTLYGIVELMRKLQNETDGEMYKLINGALLQKDTYLTRIDQIRNELENYTQNDIRLLEKLGSATVPLKITGGKTRRTRGINIGSDSYNIQQRPSELAGPSRIGIVMEDVLHSDNEYNSVHTNNESVTEYAVTNDTNNVIASMELDESTGQPFEQEPIDILRQPSNSSAILPVYPRRDITSSDIIEGEPRRKRGRPRNPNRIITEGPKRKRGRPPKNRTDFQEATPSSSRVLRSDRST